ncbi:DUF1707 and DUF4870 domain-containing protein [Bailinhaonella thermotolerans]|uniref:DUF1707 and DUF4870 domain-containing protein n=1 Tax=Bailinhaonella thermotolerans TaxID=1070861 RepID=UPI001F5B3262|nr:DUF1707 and DUF4870 domain-containing protein [Bailinhaonella thermotolerans]
MTTANPHQPSGNEPRPWHGPVPPEQAHLRVTHAHRDQVVDHLQAAFAQGRLDKDEFDERVDLAMNAKTHADLAPLLHDLLPAVPQQPRFRPHPSGPRPLPRDGADRLGAAAAHGLGLFLLPVGPLIMLATMGRQSLYVRHHAIEALNFQLTVLLSSIVLLLTVVGALLVPLIWAAWFVLTVVGGLAALGEGNFRYPLTFRMVK